jgi:DNA-binding NarL/FixJ family response regulator
MHAGNGWGAAIRAILREFPEAKIVVLSTYQGDEDILRALDAGATTYLLKDMLAPDLIRVIREVGRAGAHYHRRLHSGSRIGCCILP